MDGDVFLSKAEETYEAFLAELSKVSIKGLWIVLSRKKFNLVGFSLTKDYTCDLSFCKLNADSNT